MLPVTSAPICRASDAHDGVVAANQRHHPDLGRGAVALALVGVADRVRTGDLHLGKVTRYRLRYSHMRAVPSAGFEPASTEV